MSKLLFWFILVSIIILSLVPNSGINELSNPHFKIRVDYILHGIAYFFLSIFYFLWKLDKFRSEKNKIILVFFLILFFLAFGSEFLQIKIPGRTFNPFDIYANIAGGCIGFILILIIKIAK